MIVAVVISDRGDQYLPGCLESIRPYQHLFEQVLLVDDVEHRLGMAGAVQAGMRAAVDYGCDYALWLEEDFRFETPPPLDRMRRILDLEPGCTQVVLKRQPWSPEEAQAGGIIETHPEDYEDCFHNGLAWLRHRRIFSLNPCLIPRWVLERGWPAGNEAEQTERLVGDGFHFAFFGRRADQPMVRHVGHERGTGWRL